MTETVQPVEAQGPKGIGGWLLLVALGLFFTPFRIIIEAYQLYVPMFSDAMLQDLGDPSSPSYVAYLVPFLYFEMILNLVFLVWSLICLYFFFVKKTDFPKWYGIFLLTNLAFLYLDAVISLNFTTSAEAFDKATVKTLAQSTISTAIWVPYLYVSKRVRNTFVN